MRISVSTLRHSIVPLLCLSMAGCASRPPASLSPDGTPRAAADGSQVIRALNAAHRATWFRTLVFVQRTVYPGPTAREEVWYETMVRPGYLRIDIERDGRMVGRSIFRHDSLYQFAEGRPPVARPLVHDLLLLLHDVHVGDAEVVIGKLRDRGFDLSRTSRTRWDGRDLLVVGAGAGDTTTKQFWVDEERGVVVRVIGTAPNGVRSDTRVSGFERTASGWLERRIRFFAGDRETLYESYTWYRLGVTVPPDVFDPSHEALPDWIATYRTGAGR